MCGPFKVAFSAVRADAHRSPQNQNCKKKGKIDFHIWIIWTDLGYLLMFYGKRNDKHNHIFESL